MPLIPVPELPPLAVANPGHEQLLVEVHCSWDYQAIAYRPRRTSEGTRRWKVKDVAEWGTAADVSASRGPGEGDLGRAVRCHTSGRDVMDAAKDAEMVVPGTAAVAHADGHLLEDDEAKPMLEGLSLDELLPDGAIAMSAGVVV